MVRDVPLPDRTVERVSSNSGRSEAIAVVVAGTKARYTCHDEMRLSG